MREIDREGAATTASLSTITAEQALSTPAPTCLKTRMVAKYMAMTIKRANLAADRTSTRF